MAELIVSGQAADDLDHIFDWSAEQFGADVAEAYIRDIRATFDLLRRYPMAGEERRDTARPYRVISCRSHRLIYRPNADRVQIIRVLHFAQSADNLWGAM